MGIFSRRSRPPADAELGVGTTIPVSAVDGRPTHLVEWTRERRRTLALAQEALRVLRAAGLRGAADLRSSPLDGGADLEVVLRGGTPVRLVVDAAGGTRVVSVRDVDDHDVIGYLETERPEPLDPSTALGDVVFAMSTLVAHEGGGPSLPDPLTATNASVQLLEPTGDLPARWCVCVFLTRAHEVPADSDDVVRADLWIEHSVGVKLHLDGSVALDPEDEDPEGARSRASLATAASWAGGPVDVVPYARWLATETQRRLDVVIEGLGGV